MNTVFGSVWPILKHPRHHGRIQGPTKPALQETSKNYTVYTFTVARADVIPLPEMRGCKPRCVHHHHDCVLSQWWELACSQ